MFLFFVPPSLSEVPNIWRVLLSQKLLLLLVGCHKISHQHFGQPNINLNLNKLHYFHCATKIKIYEPSASCQFKWKRCANIIDITSLPFIEM